MPKPQQAKLLKVLDKKEIWRIGSNKPKKINVRFIAAIQPQDIDDEDKILPDLIGRLGLFDAIKLPGLEERLNKMPESVIRGSLSITLKDMGLDNKDIAFSKNIIPLIRSCDFKRNYRDLEGVLRKAVRSALKDNRNEIIQKDLSFLEQPLISKMDVIKNDYEEKLKSIKLKDIVIFAKDEAEKVAKNIRSSIIENKLIEIQKTGNDIKTVLMKREGLKLTEYQVFLGHITTYTGKKWSTIKKLLN